MSNDLIIEDQHLALEEKGYFIVRGVVPLSAVDAIRQGLMDKAASLSKQKDLGPDKVLEKVAIDDPESVDLASRFRKLNHLDRVQPFWDEWLAGEQVLEVIKPILGENILNKYASAFLKPARIGGETPWHQDIGLWQDNNSGAMNGWLAIDPATKANGCLQVVPGSHKGDIIEHVVYEDSVHAELPREFCRDLSVEHIELQPGDALFWHSHLWHYSPPNTSDQGRIGCGAVWINPNMLGSVQTRNLRWVLIDGERKGYLAPMLVCE